MTSTSDPALTTEIIRLLNDELQHIRTEIREVQHSKYPLADDAKESSTVGSEELYALQAENARIKADIEQVTARLNGLPVPQSVEGHECDDERLTKLNEEVASKDAEYERAKQTLSGKIDAMRAKYKEAKAKKSYSKSSIAEAQAMFVRIEHDHQEKSRQLNDMKAQLTTLRANVRVPFDYRAFLQSCGSGDERVVNVNFEALTSTTLKLPEGLSQLCVDGGYTFRIQHEVIWPSTSSVTGTHERCIFVSPAHQYNPKLNGSKGQWIPTHGTDRRGQSMELFYRRDTGWCYLGTYKCVGQDVHSAQKLGDLIPSQHMQTIQKNTLLFTEMIPSLICRMMKNMYKCGILKISCTGWQRTGYNAKLVHALMGDRRQASPENNPNPGHPSTISAQREGSTSTLQLGQKRDREEDASPRSSRKRRVDS